MPDHYCEECGRLLDPDDEELYCLPCSRRLAVVDDGGEAEHWRRIEDVNDIRGFNDGPPEPLDPYDEYWDRD